MYGFTVKRVKKNNPKKVLSRHTFLGKTAKAAKSAAAGFFRRVRNVEGFKDETGFHPIRGGKGYSEKRVQRAAARKHAKRARRGRTAIS